MDLYNRAYLELFVEGSHITHALELSKCCHLVTSSQHRLTCYSKAIGDSAQRIVRFHSQTPLCTARLTDKGCQSAGGNAERDGAEPLKLRLSLR